jgi:hypothetical protein
MPPDEPETTGPGKGATFGVLEAEPPPDFFEELEPPPPDEEPPPPDDDPPPPDEELPPPDDDPPPRDEEPPPLFDFVLVAEVVVDVFDDLRLVLELVVDFELVVLVEDVEVVPDEVVGLVLEEDAAAAFCAMLVVGLLLPQALSAAVSAASARVTVRTLPTRRTARAPTPTIINNYMTQ